MFKTGVSILALITALWVNDAHAAVSVDEASHTAIIKAVNNEMYQQDYNAQMLEQLGMYGALTGFNAFTQSVSNIASIQAGSIQVSTGSTTNTATISSVSTTATLIIHGGRTSDGTGADASRDHLGLSFTNATTITATRITSTTTNPTIRFFTLEFKAGVLQSNQSGTITLTAATSNTATITAVTTTNSAALWLGNTVSAAGTPNTEYGYVVLTDSTTVTTGRNTGTGNYVGYYQIAEFVSGFLNSSTQSGTINMGNGVTSNTATITAVSIPKSVLFFGNHKTNHSGEDGDHLPRMDLDLSTTVGVARLSGSGTASSDSYFTVVEFKSATIKARSSALTGPGAANTVLDITITSVDTSKTIAVWTGGFGETTGSNDGIDCATHQFTSATNFRKTRGVSDASFGCSTGAYLLEFN